MRSLLELLAGANIAHENLLITAEDVLGNLTPGHVSKLQEAVKVSRAILDKLEEISSDGKQG